MKFEEICQENYAKIYNYILAKTANREAAEDLTQDVFLIALRKGDTFLHHEKPTAFLYVTAKNLVFDYFKKKREVPARQAPLEETENALTSPDAFEALCRQRSVSVDEERYRKQVLQKLLPKERDLYRRYYVDQKPMKLIAREFRISEAALRMKYMRIRRKIRRIAAELGLDEF